jgi:hypothetical protein
MKLNIKKLNLKFKILEKEIKIEKLNLKLKIMKREIKY